MMDRTVGVRPRSFHTIWLVLAGACALAFTGPLTAQPTIDATLTAPELQVFPGESFLVVPTLLSDTDAIYGGAYALCFDPTIMTLDQVIVPPDYIMGPGFLTVTQMVDRYIAVFIHDLVGTELLSAGIPHDLFSSLHTAIATEPAVGNLEICDMFYISSQLPYLVVDIDPVYPSTVPGSVTVIDTGVLSLELPDYAITGDSFTADVVLAHNFNLHGFRWGLSHIPSLVTPVSVVPSPAVAQMNGGIGPDLFVVDLSPSGGDGVTVDCDFHMIFETILPPGTTALATIEYDALETSNSCLVTPFEFRDDLGVPTEVDLAEGAAIPLVNDAELAIWADRTLPTTAGTALKIEAAEGTAGSLGFVTVRLDSDVDVHGFSVGFQHSSPEFDLTTINVGADLAVLGCTAGPEFFATSISDPSSHGTVEAIFGAPGSLTAALPPGADLKIMGLVYQIPANPTVEQLTIDIVGGVGTPPISLEMQTSAGVQTPATTSGFLTIVERFTRGDCNLDSFVDIADAVHLLTVLFPSPGEMPVNLTCADSCDGNDDGALDVADAVALLNGLFSGGLIPAPQFCDVDPTEDALGCETNDACF